MGNFDIYLEYILKFFLIIPILLFGVLCVILLISAITNILENPFKAIKDYLTIFFYRILPSPKKQFYCGQKVLVTSGFYKGQEGVVIKKLNGGRHYRLKTSSSKLYFYNMVVKHTEIQLDPIVHSPLIQAIKGKNEQQ